VDVDWIKLIDYFGERQRSNGTLFGGPLSICTAGTRPETARHLAIISCSQDGRRRISPP
jgi:hypothetical protein